MLEWDVLPTYDPVTNEVDPTVYLTVSNEPGSKGIITGIKQTPTNLDNPDVGPVRVSVRARYLDGSGAPIFNHPTDGSEPVPIESVMLVTVTDPRLKSYELLPLTSTIAQNTQQRYSLWGILTDGSRQNLTFYYKTRLYLDSVVTSAKLLERQAIDCPNGVKYFYSDIGVVQALSPSNIRVHGWYDSPRNTRSVDLTITDAQLESISVTSADSAQIGAPLNIGDVRQYAAIGHFSDNSTQDISDLVTWSVSSPSVATVENRDVYDSVCNNRPLAVEGRVTGLSAGTTDIIATDPISGINTNLEIVSDIGNSVSLTVQ